jgi:hypothetical protein
MFFKRRELAAQSSVRDWDLILSSDGSVVNMASNDMPSLEPERVYPVRYRLPVEILSRLKTNEERIQRSELFALGSILYELISGKQLFHEEEEENIQTMISQGAFPQDLWTLPMAPRILACWCPAFAKEMLAARGAGTFTIPASPQRLTSLRRKIHTRL